MIRPAAFGMALALLVGSARAEPPTTAPAVSSLEGLCRQWILQAREAHLLAYPGHSYRVYRKQNVISSKHVDQTCGGSDEGFGGCTYVGYEDEVRFASGLMTRRSFGALYEVDLPRSLYQGVHLEHGRSYLLVIDTSTADPPVIAGACEEHDVVGSHMVRGG